MRFGCAVEVMKLCVERALNIQDEIPIVAALVDFEGYVISFAQNKTEMDGSPLDHAECLLLRKGVEVCGYRDLRKYAIVSTLEPCGMCAEACLLHRLGMVVFGAYNLSKLHKSPEHWVGGVLEMECARLMKKAFKRKKAK